MATFYVNKSLLSQNASLIPLLFPFFGQVYKEKMLNWNEVFAKYGFDGGKYQVTDKIEKSQVVVLPHFYGYLSRTDPGRLKAFVAEASRARKPILVEATGDFAGEIDIPRAIVLRSWRYRPELKPNDIIIPAYAEDLLVDYAQNKLSIRLKSDRPVVGFAGWGVASWQRTPLLYLQGLMNVFRSREDYHQNGIFIRTRALNYLQESRKIGTKFVLRSTYSGHQDLISLDPKIARREFIENILSTDYTLCVRGQSNYSIRFYETLSLGRIPLFVDTEGVLPLENRINYRGIVVSVKLRDLPRIGEILLEAHSKTGAAGFKERQIEARNIYKKYLRLDSFTPYLLEEIRKRI